MTIKRGDLLALKTKFKNDGRWRMCFVASDVDNNGCIDVVDSVGCLTRAHICHFNVVPV
jgi:hypothetical protein